MTYPISEIEGLPAFAANKLKAQGIRTTSALLEAASTAKGRKTLSHDANPDADGGLPDPAHLRHSDITTYAAPGFENEFELWSSGDDGRFDRMRDAQVNRDNIPLEPYEKGIR